MIGFLCDAYGLVCSQLGKMSQVESAASSAVKTACDIGAKAIIVLSLTGETARLVSKYHPTSLILAVCGDATIGRQIEGYMCNTRCVVTSVPRGDNRHMMEAFKFGTAKGLFKDGDAVLGIHTMRSPDGIKEWTTRILHVTSTNYSASASDPVSNKSARND